MGKSKTGIEYFYYRTIHDRENGNYLKYTHGHYSWFAKPD
jgi:hypothetical protein